MLERKTALIVGITGQDGAYLRSCRERLRLRLTQLEERTRIRSLEAIENERFDVLPPEPYVHGHVLEYARALGIEQAHTLAAAFIDRYRRARSRC